MKENKFTKVLWAALVWMVCPILSFAQQPASDEIIAEKSATTIQMPTVVQDGDPDAYFSNGSLVTHPGAGYNGADYSVTPTTNYGINFNNKNNSSIATRVIINDENLSIDSVRVYGYQNFSSLTSTFNKAFLRVWNGDPRNGGTVIWGNLTTNLFSNSYWTGIYRGETFSSTERPIMAINMNTEGLVFQNTGTYWFEFATEGTSPEGPWCPAIAVGSDLQYSAGWSDKQSLFPIDVFQSNPSCGVVLLTNKTTNGNSAQIEFEAPTETINLEYGIKGFQRGTGTKLYNVASPVMLNNLNDMTLYDVYAQVICTDSTLGSWKKLTELNTQCSGNSCGVIFNLTDSYGDGWNNAKIHVHVNGELLKTMTIASGNSYNETLNICEGAVVEVIFDRGSYSSECGLRISQAANQKILFEFKKNDSPPSGTLTSFINSCATCNDFSSLIATDIEGTSLSLDWLPADTTLNTEVTIEYGPAGFVPGMGQKITTNQKPAPITGLQEKTAYDFYLSKACADGSGIEFGRLVNVVTSCTADCRYIFELKDSFGDGWNGNSISVYENGKFVKKLTIDSGGSLLMDTLSFCDGAIINFDFNRMNYSSECQFTARKENTNEIVSQFLFQNAPPKSGILTSFVNGCGACPKLQNVQVSETNYTNCTLTWTNPNHNENTLYFIVYGEKGFTPGTGTALVSINKSIFVSGLTSGRTYDFYVSALCGTQKNITELVQVTTPSPSTCKTIFNLVDTYGDGWDSNSLEIYQNGAFIKTLTFSSGSSLSDTIDFIDNSLIELKFINGSYSEECGLTVINEISGDTIYSFLPKTDPPTGTVHSYTSSCGSCDEPSNIQVASVGRQTIDLVWDESLKNESIEVTCVPTGTNINQGSPVVTKGTGYQIKNLTGNTEYDVYVRHLCTPDKGSNWIALPSVRTGCTNVYQVEQASEIYCYGSKAAFNLSGSETGATYTAHLNGAPTTQTLQGTGNALRFENLMEAGSYTVVANHTASACAVTMQGTFELQKHPNVEFQAQIAQEPLCHNDRTGSIIIHSDARPVQYSTNGGTTWQSDSVFAQLAAASYAPAIKDSNNCVFTGEPIVLQNPAELKINSIMKTNLTASAANDGFIIITAAGGTGVLQYTIDNGSNWNTSNGFTSLGSNTYVVQVKDANNCSTSYANNPVIVEFRSDVNALQNSDAITVYPNPTSAFINLSGTTGTVAYELFNQAGQRVLNGQWTEASQPIDVRNLANGIYLLKVQHSNGQQQLKVIKRN